MAQHVARARIAATRARSLRADGRQHRSRTPAGRHRCRQRVAPSPPSADAKRCAARRSLSARSRTSAARSSRLSASAAVDGDRDFRRETDAPSDPRTAQRADRAASALASSISSGSSPASGLLRTGTPSAAAMLERARSSPRSAAPNRASVRAPGCCRAPVISMMPLPCACARVAQRGEGIERDGSDRQQPHQQSVAGRHGRRSRTGPGRRRGAECKGVAVANIAALMSLRPHAPRSAARPASMSLRRGCQKPCRRAASSRSAMRARQPRIFAQQKVAHRAVGDIGVVQRDRTIRSATAPVVSREGDKPVDGFGQLGGAARAVAHLPGDEARVDRARPHDPRQRRRQRSRARPLRIGDVEHDEIDGAAEQLPPRRQSRRRRRRPRRLRADRGRDRRSDARAGRRWRRAARRRRARRRLRRRRRHRRARRRRDRRRRWLARSASRPSRSSTPAP